MNNTSKIISNENLFGIILSYLQLNDLITMSSVNKKSHQYTNKIWNEKCRDRYTSSYEDYSILSISKQDIFQNNFEFPLSTNFNEIDWKKFFRIGNEIKFGYSLINNDSNFDFKPSDSCSLRDKMFSMLKENSLNTLHQTFLYDFVYDTQELYSYYKKNSQEGEVVVRNKSLLFFSWLKDVDYFYELSEEDISKLEQFRFYSSDIENFDILNLSHEDANSLVVNFTSIVEQYLEKLKKMERRNPLITLLQLIYISLVYFCVFTYTEISRQCHNSFSYMDSIAKRYNSYCECATHLNEEMENLNVLVNLVYERLCSGGEEVHPKFSLYRMMMIIFNRIVLTPLADEKYDKNVPNLLYQLSGVYFNGEMKKIFEEKKISYSNSSTESDDDLCSISTYQSLINDINNVNETESSEIEFQLMQFLEEIPLIYLDSICNEYSVFYLNSTKFPIDGVYKKIQTKLVDIICNLVKNCYTKDNSDVILKFIKENEIINTKFVNITKHAFIINASKALMQKAKDDMVQDFKDFIHSSGEFRLGSPRGDTNDKVEKEKEKEEFLFFEELSSVDSEATQDQIDKFCSQFSKTKNYQTMVETEKFMREETSERENEDEIIKHETTRRNILLTKKIYNPSTWNFDMNLCVDDIIDSFVI